MTQSLAAVLEPARGLPRVCDNETRGRNFTELEEALQWRSVLAWSSETCTHMRVHAARLETVVQIEQLVRRGVALGCPVPVSAAPLHEWVDRPRVRWHILAYEAAQEALARAMLASEEQKQRADLASIRLLAEKAAEACQGEEQRRRERAFVAGVRAKLKRHAALAAGLAQCIQQSTGERRGASGAAEHSVEQRRAALHSMVTKRWGAAQHCRAARRLEAQAAGAAEAVRGEEEEARAALRSAAEGAHARLAAAEEAAARLAERHRHWADEALRQRRQLRERIDRSWSGEATCRGGEEAELSALKRRAAWLQDRGSLHTVHVAAEPGEGTPWRLRALMKGLRTLSTLADALPGEAAEGGPAGAAEDPVAPFGVLALRKCLVAPAA